MFVDFVCHSESDEVGRRIQKNLIRHYRIIDYFESPKIGFFTAFRMTNETNIFVGTALVAVLLS